jgi:hypothetical protein
MLIFTVKYLLKLDQITKYFLLCLFIFLCIQTSNSIYWYLMVKGNPITGLDRPWGFQEVEAPRFLRHLSPPPYALHAPPISFFSILPPAQYWVRNTDHSAPHCVTFSIPLVASCLLGPNTLLNTLFSNIHRLRISLSDQVSDPYKTPGKIIVLYILIFKCLDSKLEDRSISRVYDRKLGLLRCATFIL